MPRQNEAVNEIWLCDKGRFTHHHMDHPERLATPLVRKGGRLVEATWDEALDAVAGYLKAAGPAIAAIAGGRLSNEDYYAIQKVVRARLSDDLAPYPDTVAGGEYAAWVGVGAGTNLQQMGQGDAILVVGTDLYHSGPVWYLRVKAAAERGAALITVNARATRLDKYAAHALTVMPGEEAATLSALPEEAAKAVAEAANVVAFVGGDGLDAPGADRVAKAAANLLIEGGHVGRANNGLIVVWPGANGQGGSDMGLRPDYRPGYQPVERVGRGYADILAALASNEVKAVWIAGADPVFDDPAAERALRDSNATIIVQEMFLTLTAELADVVLPVQSTGEREGTYTSGERRVQRFYPAIEPVGESLPDWEIAERIGERLGGEKPHVSAAALMLEIAQAVPQYAGISYQKLAEVHEQWPDVGGDDLYYGGTAFQNTRGLGVQVPALAEDASASLAVTPVEPGSRVKAGKGELLILPVRVLYDAEMVFALGAPVLSERITLPTAVLSPADARRLDVELGDLLEVTFDDRSVQVAARVDEGVPGGVVVMPARVQAQGTPLAASAARIARLERVQA
jgi:NADH-quinone oxidoreductase subunit G